MKQTPMFSVVLPTYNRPDLLKRAIQSVLSQTWTDFELVIVDDGSTSNIYSIVGSFIDRRMIYLRLPNNQGPAAARNAGIVAARGNFIAFQDSDDMWSPDHLEAARLAYARNADTDVTYGRMQVDSPAARIWPARDLGYEPRIVFRALCGGNVLGLPSVTVRRSALNQVGMFDQRLRTLEDWDLLLRLASSGNHFTFVDMVSVSVTTSTHGVNAFSRLTSDAAGRIISKYTRQIGDKVAFKRLLGQCRYLQGIGYIASRDFARGKASLRAAVRADPCRPKHLLALGLAFLTSKHFLQVLTRAKSWRGSC